MPRKRYDYEMAALSWSCSDNDRGGYGNKQVRRVLRKLVREAAMDAFRACPGFHDREMVADHIAKELVP